MLKQSKIASQRENNVNNAHSGKKPLRQNKGGNPTASGRAIRGITNSIVVNVSQNCQR
jgi:hypothetical protein